MNVTCPLCGQSLSLDVACWRHYPGSPVVYDGVISCDCVTGEAQPLLIARGESEEAVKTLAREQWNAMPHSRNEGARENRHA